MTIQLNFTEEDKIELQHERYNHPSPLVQRRMEALLLKSYDLPHELIAKIVGVCPNTMRDYFRLYEEGGVNKLKELNYYRPESELCEHITSLEEYFATHPPATVKEAQHAIEKITGIKRSDTQIRKFLLNKLKLRRRKIGMIPAKADPDEQKKYLDEKLKPRLEEAKAGKRAVYFVDAAHFVHSPYLGYLWSALRLFIPAPSGRKRYNVLGALNAVSHQVCSFMNTTYINAKTVCLLLEKLAKYTARGSRLRFSSKPTRSSNGPPMSFCI
jgi:transposase